MQKQEQAAWVREGRCALGIELGSTRIKAVLIGPDHAPVAMGAHDWENRLEDGVWTYHMDDVWQGIQSAYADLAANVEKDCGERLSRLEAVGVSAMMHGYLPFDAARLDLGEDRLQHDKEAQQQRRDHVGPGGAELAVGFDQRGDGAVDEHPEEGAEHVAHAAGEERAADDGG